MGICLGMQTAIIEFARNVLGYHDANSMELNPDTLHPVIALMPEQNGVEDLGGTLTWVLPLQAENRNKILFPLWEGGNHRTPQTPL